MRAALRRFTKSAPDSVSGSATADSAVSAPGIDTAPMPVFVDSIAVGDFPTGLAVSPDGGRVYVVNTSANSVTVIDTATNSAVDTIAVGARPYGIAIAPDGTHAFVVNAADGTLSKIKLPAGKVTATISVGNDPYDVCIHPDGSQLLVTNQDDGTVSFVDAAARNGNRDTESRPRPDRIGAAPRRHPRLRRQQRLGHPVGDRHQNQRKRSRPSTSATIRRVLRSRPTARLRSSPTLQIVLCR